jgi:RNA polymerase sigma factor (sigma-70 family)
VAVLRELDSAELVCLCAEDRDNSALWSEFLRRFTTKIKCFIRGTLRQSFNGNPSSADLQVLPGAIQESDLFQNVIVRLVENDCAALKRFTGTTEADLLAYFAVIARSAVRDCLRRQRSLKRPRWQRPLNTEELKTLWSHNGNHASAQESMEREILAREVAQLGEEAIRNYSGEDSPRDRLLFELYFFHGLSTTQIAECQGIGLSKTGVEKALKRLKYRIRCATAEEDVGEGVQQ